MTLTFLPVATHVVVLDDSDDIVDALEDAEAPAAETPLTSDVDLPVVQADNAGTSIDPHGIDLRVALGGSDGATASEAGHHAIAKRKS